MLSSTLSGGHCRARPRPRSCDDARRAQDGRLAGGEGGGPFADANIPSGPMRTGTNEVAGCGVIEMPGSRSSRANRNHV